MTTPEHPVTPIVDVIARAIWQAGLRWDIAFDAALRVRHDMQRAEYEARHETEEK